MSSITGIYREYTIPPVPRGPRYAQVADHNLWTMSAGEMADFLADCARDIRRKKEDEEIEITDNEEIVI